MNILLLTQTFPPAKGGSGRWLWELYRRLRESDVAVVAGRSDGFGKDAEFDRTSNLATTRIHLAFRSWGVTHVRSAIEYATAFAALNSIVSRVRPQAVHCGKCLPEGLLALAIKKWKRIPFWCFVHGEELTLAQTSRELHRLSRLVLHQAERVVANSDHSKRILLERWDVPADRVVVMHPGVDVATFRPAPRDEQVRARLGWTGRRVVLTVGALQKRKGQDMLIRALPAIRARCPDVLYAIVGEGWEREYLDSLVAEHDVADLVQFRPTPGDEELIACYQQCDLFALPNRQVGWDFEGFGIVLLEAQACGKPVVAGRSGGTSETMKPSCTGELVPCETPEPLADAVVRLLDAPDVRSRMGACAREWAVERFDWPMLVAQASGMFGGRA